MRAPSRLASTCLLLSAAAWLGACPVAPSYPSCAKDAHCARGEPCVDGLCQDCASDAECEGKGPQGSDLVCLEFRCSEPAAGEADPCAACDPGLVCREGSCEACTEGGQCHSGVCHPSGRCQALPCATDDGCPDAQICDGGQCLYYADAKDAGVCGLSSIYFAYDSAQLSPDNQTRLVGAAGCLAQLEGVLVLEASADAVGTAEYNTLLAQRRGETVLRFLAQQGVERARISVAELPAADGGGERSHAPQRRVRLVVENE